MLAGTYESGDATGFFPQDFQINSYYQEMRKMADNPVNPKSGSMPVYKIGCLKGTVTGNTWNVKEGSSLYVGRDTNCDIVLASSDSKVSRKHLKIMYGAEGVILNDLGSSNGTFIKNRQRIQPGVDVVIKPGERFWLGSEAVEFILGK